MNSTATPTTPRPKYPCLMELTEKPGQIVLATGPGDDRDYNFKGVVVAMAPSGAHPLGTDVANWVRHCFRPYTGTVTLQS